MAKLFEQLTAKELARVQALFNTQLVNESLPLEHIVWFLELHQLDRTRMIHEYLVANGKSVLEKKETFTTVPSQKIYTIANRDELFPVKNDGGPYGYVDDILKTIPSAKEFADSVPITATLYECSSKISLIDAFNKAIIAEVFKGHVFEAAALLAQGLTTSFVGGAHYEIIIPLKNDNDKDKDTYYIHVMKDEATGVYRRRAVPGKKLPVDKRIVLVF